MRGSTAFFCYSFGQTGFGVAVGGIRATFFHAVFVRCRSHPCSLFGLSARAHFASNPDVFKIKKRTSCMGMFFFCSIILSGKQDLNLRPQRPERRALPTALLPDKKTFQLVGRLGASDGARTRDLRRDRPAR